MNGYMLAYPSLVIRVDMESFWERVLVPQVGELYTLLVDTMDAVNREGRTAAANGQFILIRRDVYARLGSLPEVKADIAEDRALAAACKHRGHRVRLEYGRTLVRARFYTSFREMWKGYSKPQFWASGHNTARAASVAIALALYAVPLVMAFAYALLNPRHTNRARAFTHAPMQIVPMLVVRGAVCKQMGISPLYAATYPLGVLLGDALLLYSLYRVISGKGVSWKGRTYT